MKLSKPAFDDVLRLKCLSLTEAADETGLPLKTLSGLRLGRHKASMTTARQLSGALGVAASTLFPDLLESVENAGV